MISDRGLSLWTSNPRNIKRECSHSIDGIPVAVNHCKSQCGWRIYVNTPKYGPITIGLSYTCCTNTPFDLRTIGKHIRLLTVIRRCTGRIDIRIYIITGGSFEPGRSSASRLRFKNIRGSRICITAFCYFIESNSLDYVRTGFILILLRAIILDGSCLGYSIDSQFQLSIGLSRIILGIMNPVESYVLTNNCRCSRRPGCGRDWLLTNRC